MLNEINFCEDTLENFILFYISKFRNLLYKIDYICTYRKKNPSKTHIYSQRTCFKNSAPENISFLIK